MKIWISILLIITVTTSFSQTTLDDNLIFWSSDKKLTVDDFGIKTKNSETSLSFAQFSVDYQVSGFDFMRKNFNNKVRNCLIKSASWIDTTVNVSNSIRYQQTLFDICEIYTRKFRMELKKNRKKIASGTQFVDKLNQEIMTEFSNRRIIYDRETNFGTIEEKQQEWELQINKELDELKEFERKE